MCKRAYPDERKIQILDIEFGKPQQNTYIERYNQTVRYEWLSQHLWESNKAVQTFETQRMNQFNYDRPFMSLVGMAPKQ